MVTKKQLDALKKMVVDVCHPKSIFLFGSYAKGNPRENSDIDLAIIKDKIKDRHKELYKIRKALFEQWVPMDLVLLDEKEYLSKKDSWGTVQYEIDKHGVKLYEQP